jgi:hypothetical protein
MKYEFIGLVKYILKLGEHDFYCLVWYIGMCLLSTLVSRNLLTSGLGSWNNRSPRSRACYFKNTLAQGHIAWCKYYVFWSNFKNLFPMIPLGYPHDTHMIPIKNIMGKEKQHLFPHDTSWVPTWYPHDTHQISWEKKNNTFSP